MELARHGAYGDTGVWRTVYSPEWVAARDLLVQWFEDSGLTVHQDAIGNVWGRLKGSEGTGGKSIVAGSHFDSQRPGGRYDGALGVIAALVAVRALQAQFGQPKRTVEVLALCEEESSRFPTASFLGSRAITGAITPADLEEMIGYEGETAAEAMAAIGLDHTRVAEAQRDDIDTYIELHIEQGPILEQAGLPVGIVNAINGIRHYIVEIKGRSDHAGARPMDTRLDPMAGAAEIISGVIQTAIDMGRPAVTTVGRMQVEPGGPAIVPDRVVFTIDARHSDPAGRLELYAAHERLIRAVAERRGLTVSWETTTELPPCQSDPDVVSVLEQAAQEQGVAYQVMPSGAVHDAQRMATIAKMAMIFVQSKDGRSHTPDEFTTVDDAVAGIQVLAGGLHKLAY